MLNLAAPQGQAVGLQAVGGSGGLSTGITVEVANRKFVRAEQQLAKMRVWLASDDRILVAEAQPFFAAQAQQKSISLISTAVVAMEQPEGCLSEGAVMPGGFGRSQPQHRSGKTALQEIRQLSVAPQLPVQEPDVALAIQAEVEAFLCPISARAPRRDGAGMVCWSL